MLPTRVKVVYIAGLGRSGSTLLGALLGQLDGFFYLGELVHTQRSLAEGAVCGCKEILTACPTWRAIFSAAFPEKSGAPDSTRLGFDAADASVLGLLRQCLRASGLLPRSERLDRCRAEFEALLRAIPQATGNKVLVDSSKLPGFCFFLQQIACVELYVVHLVRDPRAVAYSRLRTGDRRGNALRPAPPGFAVVWDIWNSAIELIWRRDRYIRVRYEDVVHHPEAVVARVAALTGERAVGLRVVSGDCVAVTPTHTVGGNRSRFQTGEVRLRLDDEWTSAQRFTSLARLAVTALTWPWRIRYGYRRAEVRAAPASAVNRT